jgi:hypothetical protein
LTERSTGHHLLGGHMTETCRRYPQHRCGILRNLSSAVQALLSCLRIKSQSPMLYAMIIELL